MASGSAAYGPGTGGGGDNSDPADADSFKAGATGDIGGAVKDEWIPTVRDGTILRVVFGSHRPIVDEVVGIERAWIAESQRRRRGCQQHNERCQDSDQGKKQFEPFLYQAFTEIGYYNYDTTDFKPYMKTLKNPSNLAICPAGATIVYNPATMAFVYHFLQYEANHVAYIYGELDAWSATQMQLIGRTDAIKIVVADSHHGARISSFSPEQKDLFYSSMERWLGLKLARQ